MQKCKCKQCGFEWLARKSKPVECPECKSRKWFKERRQDDPLGLYEDFTRALKKGKGHL